MTLAEQGRTVGAYLIEQGRAQVDGQGNTEQRVDRVFKALADCTRRKILCLLHESSQSVSDIVDRFHLTQPSISRHLAILRGAGLVAYDRRGQRMIYRLGEPEPVKLAMSFLAGLNGSPAAELPRTGRGSRS